MHMLDSFKYFQVCVPLFFKTFLLKIINNKKFWTIEQLDKNEAQFLPCIERDYTMERKQSFMSSNKWFGYYVVLGKVLTTPLILKVKIFV